MFALLLLLLVAAPWLAGKRYLPPREAVYSSTAWRFGSYPWLERQIFHETNDIDIAFMGSSHVWYGINTPYVQKELSRQLGRQATVRTMCWYWPGFDPLYYIAKDLMEHRKVRLLVFCNEEPVANARPQALSHRWFRFGDGAEDAAGLPARDRFSLYAGAILGMPRNLLCLVRPNMPVDLDSGYDDFYKTQYQAANPMTRLGALAIPLAFHYQTNFTRYQPEHPVSAASVCIYSAQTRANFAFGTRPLQPTSFYFLKKLAALAQKNGTTLLILHFPETDEFNSSKIPERFNWPELLGTSVTLAGVPGATLFSGMTDQEKLLFFCDPDHLNQNGQEFFTPVITPALIKAYETDVKN